jgi:hypothetical protein
MEAFGHCRVTMAGFCPNCRVSILWEGGCHLGAEGEVEVELPLDALLILLPTLYNSHSHTGDTTQAQTHKHHIDVSTPKGPLSTAPYICISSLDHY